ncbi:MAG: S9 family peptidase [Candidatus Paceibacterota bacterium]|jgi:oligopeptidase B
MFSTSEYVKKGITPPVAKRLDFAHDYHGEKYEDKYNWLKDINDPDTLKYIKTENSYADAVMAETKELQTKLYKEMLGRIKETDMSVPERIDIFYYYLRTEEGKQYPVYCRKPIDSEVEQILLDENELAKDHEFFSIGTLSVSPDHKILAYAVNTSGDEIYTLYFKNLETGELFADTVTGVAANFEWANDNATYFYSVLDETKRPAEIHRRKLGNEAGALIYKEEDSRFVTYVSKSRSEKYLFINSDGYTTSETQYMDADKPEEKFSVFIPRAQDIEYDVEHHEAGVYIITNENAINFKVLFAKSFDAPKSSWVEFVPHNDDVTINDVDAFKNFIVLEGRKHGLQFLKIYDLEKKSWRDITFDDASYAFGVGSNPEYDSETLRFTYSSLRTPSTVYDYDMRTHERTVRKQEEVVGGYDSSLYTVERFDATSHDGTKVPVSIFYKTALIKKDGASPTLLTAYGAYGISYDLWFSSTRLSLADRGYVMAFANPRGGGELGRRWYHEGKFLKKKNTFLDFIASAEELIKRKYTKPEKLIAAGGSAGGLLMGAVANLRPELFRAVVAHVPFVDSLNTMMDSSLPLTVGEYEEWGNPNERAYFDYIKSYAPYTNLEAKAYPHMLVLGGMNDARVAYWEPAKWVAKLRALKTDDNVILLKTHLGAGHGGPSGRYNALRELAFEYAFILRVLE